MNHHHGRHIVRAHRIHRIHRAKQAEYSIPVREKIDSARRQEDNDGYGIWKVPVVVHTFMTTYNNIIIILLFIVGWRLEGYSSLSA
jgi:hypothetical protein